MVSRWELLTALATPWPGTATGRRVGSRVEGSGSPNENSFSGDDEPRATIEQATGALQCGMQLREAKEAGAHPPDAVGFKVHGPDAFMQAICACAETIYGGSAGCRSELQTVQSRRRILALRRSTAQRRRESGLEFRRT